MLTHNILGLATVTCIWHIYSAVLRVPSLYHQHDGRADYVAVFVWFSYGWAKSCVDLISAESMVHKFTDLKL
jgi:hypothetical protein